MTPTARNLDTVTTVFGIRARLNHASTFESIAKQWQGKVTQVIHLLLTYEYQVCLSPIVYFHSTTYKFTAHHVEFIKKKSGILSDGLDYYTSLAYARKVKNGTKYKDTQHVVKQNN